MLYRLLRWGWRRAKRIWFAVKRLAYHRRVRRTVLGFDLHLDLRDNVQRSLAVTGDYEPDTRELLVRELRPGDVVVDIGAHVGVHALSCARALDGTGHVHAFEPQPANAEALRSVAERARLQNLTVHQVAVGEAPGSLALRADPWFGNRDLGVVGAFGEGRVVATADQIRIDDLPELERLDVVKIDIEGSEFAALRGMRRTLTDLRPRLVVIEIQDHLLQRAGVGPQDISVFMSECGYTLSGWVDRNAVFRPSEA